MQCKCVSVCVYVCDWSFIIIDYLASILQAIDAEY